jgi:hypothetical protein
LLFFSVLVAQRLLMATPAKRALDFDDLKEGVVVNGGDVVKKNNVSEVIKEVDVTPSDENITQKPDQKTDPVIEVDVTIDSTATPSFSKPTSEPQKEESKSQQPETSIKSDPKMEQKADPKSEQKVEPKVDQPKSYREKVVNGNSSPKSGSPKTSKSCSTAALSSTTSATTATAKTASSREPAASCQTGNPALAKTATVKSTVR